VRLRTQGVCMTQVCMTRPPNHVRARLAEVGDAEEAGDEAGTEDCGPKVTQSQVVSWLQLMGLINRGFLLSCSVCGVGTSM